jgi:hypothetical protein
MADTILNPTNISGSSAVNNAKNVNLGPIKINLNSSVNNEVKSKDAVDQLVNVERQAVYGCPSEDFVRISALMTALGFRFVNPQDQSVGDIKPEHVPMFMVLVKLSRLSNCKNAFHADSWLDVKGYAKTAEIVNEKLYA